TQQERPCNSANPRDARVAHNDERLRSSFSDSCSRDLWFAFKHYLDSRHLSRSASCSRGAKPVGKPLYDATFHWSKALNMIYRYSTKLPVFDWLSVWI